MNIELGKKEYLLGLAAYAVLEFWLGRTKKTRASSALDLILVGASIVVAIIKLKTRGTDGKDGNSGS